MDKAHPTPHLVIVRCAIGLGAIHLHNRVVCGQELRAQLCRGEVMRWESQCGVTPRGVDFRAPCPSCNASLLHHGQFAIPFPLLRRIAIDKTRPCATSKASCSSRECQAKGMAARTHIRTLLLLLAHVRRGQLCQSSQHRLCAPIAPFPLHIRTQCIKVLPSHSLGHEHIRADEELAVADPLVAVDIRHAHHGPEDESCARGRKTRIMCVSVFAGASQRGYPKRPQHRVHMVPGGKGREGECACYLAQEIKFEHSMSHYGRLKEPSSDSMRAW